MNLKTFYLWLASSLLLVGCGSTTFHTGPSLEIDNVAKVYVNLNTKKEIVVGGEFTLLNKNLDDLGGIGWDVGFEHTYNEARQTSNMLYILYEDDQGHVRRETWSFAQPFEVEFADDEWVGRIAQAGGGNVVVYVNKNVLSAPQQDGSYARISSQVEEVNLRRSPGYVQKDDTRDVITVIPSSAIVEVLDGPQTADGLSWWYVSWNGYTGWIAEYTGSGKKIMVFDP